MISAVKRMILNINDSRKNFRDHHKHLKYNVYITTQDNKKIGAYLLEPECHKDPKKFIVALHGKGCSREDYVSNSKIHTLVNLGYCVLVPDYRGFADSEGEFKIDMVNLDIMACFEYLTSRFDAQEIHMIGHSLGTGIMAEYYRYITKNNIEAKYHPRKMFMISAFTSIIDVGMENVIFRTINFLVPWIKERVLKEIGYDTVKNIESAKGRDLFLYHGMKDDVVPYHHSVTLSKKYGAKIKLSDHGHGNILKDEELWNDIHLNISEDLCENKM
ncbi:uncharacterized protein Eint_011260 [Encephalitozoon intestinalis ATCC 50506]|uniref:AB hydrolase-1 domain-containing protein n=1 Tax=Encephalitozoon intestinalis (strain ATCC 50506) TaxID=876142 RepID=E0S5K3_ENCIT|nr:uncharacterized protein Eint_011260 [Encephalitozoon intestinalis ATCC 50506]ADM10988.1 hypothetical protein Eint_011260 [Encephalitozoon intestinalis ATCC 50506]UTX44625.1 esterase [Encephalitozoon intestinalis]